MTRPAENSSEAGRAALERNIGVDRLAGYMASTGGDMVAALDLYLWNTSVSAACFEDLSLLEVALRNACHGQLRAWHAGQGQVTPWYFMTGLEPRHMADIAQARQRVQQGRNEETEGRVVSELTLGFWRLLHAKVYEHTLWKDVLRFAYPYQPASDRGHLYSRLDHVNTLQASGAGYALAYREARRRLDDGEPLEFHLVERDLALHMGRSTKFNREQLNTLVTVFRFGALLLVVEVLAWVVALVAAR